MKQFWQVVFCLLPLNKNGPTPTLIVSFFLEAVFVLGERLIGRSTCRQGQMVHLNRLLEAVLPADVKLLDVPDSPGSALPMNTLMMFAFGRFLPSLCVPEFRLEPARWTRPRDGRSHLPASFRELSPLGIALEKFYRIQSQSAGFALRSR